MSAPIVERLRRVKFTMPLTNGVPDRQRGWDAPINPDGPEAADTLEEMGRLLAILEWGDEDRPGCPFCGMGKRTGHLDRCQLADALAKVRP